MQKMNQYVLCEDYIGKSADGEECVLKKGTRATQRDCFIYVGDTRVCTPSSEVAHRYFASDYDGKGLIRGRWIKRLAYWTDEKQKGSRLTEDQRRILQEYYPRYLRHDVSVVLFNERFYTSPVSHLEQMGQDLKMKLEDMK